MGNMLFNNFGIVGDMTWTGGSFNPGVDCTAGSVKSDMWQVFGNATIKKNAGNNSPSINPVPRLVPAGGIQANKTWTVFKQFPFNGVGKLTGDDPSVPQGWTLVPVLDNNGNKILYNVQS
jgi:hypothetical protein